MQRLRLSGMKYIVGRIVQAETVILAVVGALCLILGWRSADEITQALWVAAVLILAGGGAALVAGLNQSRHLENHYVLTAMHVLRDEERIHQDKLEMQQGRLLLVQSLLLGGLTIAIAAVIDLVAG
jgi:lysylphosphatidylglycerol synthetase-like protein (DUF2156 family)